MTTRNHIHALLGLMLISLGRGFCGEEDENREINLKGQWRFEIGNQEIYASPEFKDDNWETIHVPGSWEDNGFPGYDGFAWYRKWVTVDSDLKGSSLILKLGRIDAVDRIYLNGHFINGSGTFPPNYQSAWNERRSYSIPPEHIRFGQPNLVAVQVYDDNNVGGIMDGQIGIYSKPRKYKIVLNLEGMWKFTTGDNPDWGNADFNTGKWDSISVPGKWEFQGFPDYDGYAWYQKLCVIPKALKKDRLILALGKIDDIDELYFNGIRIGRTGSFPDPDNSNAVGQYARHRFYAIPATSIKWNHTNTIAVRVYDTWGSGGIYEGPVGFITRDEYLRIRRNFK